MNKYLDLIKPRYVIRLKDGYIEYIENEDTNKVEYGVVCSILYAKDYSYQHALKLCRSLKKQGEKAKIFVIEGI